jgi:hypothetical protein
VGKKCRERLGRVCPPRRRNASAPATAVEGVNLRCFWIRTSEQGQSPLRGGFPAANDHHQENEFWRWANHACKHVQLLVRGIGPICPTARASERRLPADRSGLLNSASYCCRNPDRTTALSFRPPSLNFDATPNSKVCRYAQGRDSLTTECLRRSWINISLVVLDNLTGKFWRPIRLDILAELQHLLHQS